MSKLLRSFWGGGGGGCLEHIDSIWFGEVEASTAHTSVDCEEVSHYNLGYIVWDLAYLWSCYSYNLSHL